METYTAIALGLGVVLLAIIVLDAWRRRPQKPEDDPDS
jgi:hypothetical protein